MIICGPIGLNEVRGEDRLMCACVENVDVWYGGSMLCDEGVKDMR